MKLRSLARTWRIVRELDLRAIKRAAESPVRLLVAGDRDDARALAALISGSPAARPDLLVAGTEGLGTGAADRPDLAILVSRASQDGSRALADALRRERVPTAQVVIGASGWRRWGRDGVAVNELDDSAVEPIASSLFAVIASDRRLALARQFPPLRPALLARLIDETARANAGYAFSTGVAEAIPIVDLGVGIADIVILTKNQLVMSYKIALAAGLEGSTTHLMTEIVGVLGAGVLLRQAARELVGLIPVVGIVPKVAVAYAGTWAMGRAVVLWATEGQRVNAGALRQLYANGLERGRSVAQRITAGVKRMRAA